MAFSIGSGLASSFIVGTGSILHDTVEVVAWIAYSLEKENFIQKGMFQFNLGLRPTYT